MARKPFDAAFFISFALFVRLISCSVSVSVFVSLSLSLPCFRYTRSRASSSFRSLRPLTAIASTTRLLATLPAFSRDTLFLVRFFYLTFVETIRSFFFILCIFILRCFIFLSGVARSFLVQEEKKVHWNRGHHEIAAFSRSAPPTIELSGFSSRRDQRKGDEIRSLSRNTGDASFSFFVRAGCIVSVADVATSRCRRDHDQR